MASPDDHDRRIRKLEGWKMIAEARFDTLDRKIDDNTRLTKGVKDDTATIVAWTEAARIGGTGVKWLASLGAAIMTIWVGFLTWMHFRV